MIILIREDKQFQEDVTELFESYDDAIRAYGESGLGTLSIIECEPVEGVGDGWTWNGSEWNKPEMEGSEYDIKDRCFYSHPEYRRILHERTTNDTMEALRKIREGDTSEDWKAWLDKLDAYNLAVEQTKDMEEPTYPEYPTR